MQPKHIRIHQAIAEKIKIVNYANQNSIHMEDDKMELKQNLLEIGKKIVAGVTKNVRQIYQKYSSSWKKAVTDEVENEIVGWILINRS